MSRPGVRSGTTRIPDENRFAENFYVIVEAITPDGRALTLPITSEEDGRTRRVALWGLRVDEAVYESVRADKQNDGIVNDAVVGAKVRGVLEPEYTISTTGAAITEW